MNKYVAGSVLVAFMSSLPAHAGLFDTLTKVNQVVSAARGSVPETQASAPVIDQNQLAQGLASTDCATLNVMAATLQQQLQVIPQENQVSKTAGLMGKAGGLFATVAGVAGVNTQAVQQAAQLANHANSVAETTSTLDPQAAAALSQQLAAVRIMQQAKTCR